MENKKLHDDNISMASKLKLEKLTENYQKSTTYGKKIELELAEVAE